MIDELAGVLAAVVRGGVVESVHRGHLVARHAGGSVTGAIGDPDVTIFPRSSLKPVQAVAMLRAGVELDGELLALACASHSGEPMHVDGVRRILAGAGRTEDDLENTPSYPLSEDVGASWRADGHAPSSLAQNCSGKHAAMIATCVAAGWPVAGYRDPAHPLQRAIRAVVAELTGAEPEHVTVDGCGAPLYSCTLSGLAHAFSALVTAPEGSAERRVAAAMAAHPAWVGGSTGRIATELMTAVPGLVAKEGAEGVCAAALPGGAALAVKTLDGSMRPVKAVVAAALATLGATVPAHVGDTPVEGGGARVGEVRPAPVAGRPPSRHEVA